MKHIVTCVSGFIGFHSGTARATKRLCGEQGDDVYWLICGGIALVTKWFVIEEL